MIHITRILIFYFAIMIATPTVLKLIELNTDEEISMKVENELEDKSKLKFYFETKVNFDIINIDENKSSKITSSNENFMANLHAEIFIPPPELT